MLIKSSLLFIIFSLAFAATDELFKAMSDQCQLENADRASDFFSEYSIFTHKLELAFHDISMMSTNYQTFLRELDAPYIWMFMTAAKPQLLQDLKIVREEIIELNKEFTLSESCLDWINKLIGDGTSTFAGSYFELLIKSLSLTKHIKLAEMSTKKLLFFRVELRRMHVEREYLFTSRSEERHEFYCHYVFLYMTLINRMVGDTVFSYANQNTLSLTSLTPEQNGQFTRHPMAYYMEFFRIYVDPQKVFFTFNNRTHLRKTRNFKLVYQKWLAILSLIPDTAIRREYFDETKDLIYNVEQIGARASSLYERRNCLRSLLEWDNNDLTNLTLTFDLVDSIISFTQQKIRVTKIRRMLFEVMECIQRLIVFIKTTQNEKHKAIDQ